MVTIKNNQYIMENARKKRKFMEFVLIIIRTVQTTKMPMYNQIILIYIGFEFKFRRDLFKPIENTIINSYFQKLKNNQKIMVGYNHG